MLVLKDYQERALDVLKSYLGQVCEIDAKRAFVLETGRPYIEIPAIPGLPYVCLKVPTGGGKTFIAAHSVGIIAQEYLQEEEALVLWLVPSNAIREQTLTALNDREHPYRKVIDEAFDGHVAVMELIDALYIQKSTLDSGVVIIVATLAALRVEVPDNRKFYESSGALQHHFDGLPKKLLDTLSTNDDGQLVYSLANVIRMYRPIVIMDEAHNARTHLSFNTLARINPSCVIEFTATPELTHKPENQQFASNILYQVSARELKAASMIKLPIKLHTRADWQEIIGNTIEAQRSLEKIALSEEEETGEYIRPIVLIQAQSISGNDISVVMLKKSLVQDFDIKEEEIAIATGSIRELDDIDLFHRACSIRFIITVRAIVEGWDCSFAYILCSVSEVSTPRSVEQLLGRILRMPKAETKQNDALNYAYAFAASNSFIKTAQTLRDALVDGAGFQLIEVNDLVTTCPMGQLGLSTEGAPAVYSSEQLQSSPDLIVLDQELAARVAFDPVARTITVEGALTENQMQSLQECFHDEQDKAVIQHLYELVHGGDVATEDIGHEDPFLIPQMAIRIDGELELFDERHFLETIWELASCDARLTESEFSVEAMAGMSGEIDVTEEGRIEARFISDLREQMILLFETPDISIASLVIWLDRRISHPDVTQTQSNLFIHNVIKFLTDNRAVSMQQLARFRFRLAKVIERKIDEHRDLRAKKAYQAMLFGPDAATIQVAAEICLRYEVEKYAPNWYYEGSYRFRKHVYPNIGQLKSEGEEFECAVFIDQNPNVKRWIRNLERRPDSSFWLQTSTDRFYPDFVAELIDGRVLTVEYKGEDRWSNDDSKEKRVLGELWAERSERCCLFIMPKGKDFASIDELIK